MPGPTRRCWLHIGTPKTGSTSLQHFLSDNEGALGRRGFIYPSAGRRAGGHHDPAFLLAGGYPEWAKPQPKPLPEIADEIRAQIEKTDSDAIFSSENFYLLCRPERVRDFFSDLGFSGPGAIKIIVYIRRQDDAVMSWYNQAVKAQGFTGSLAEHVATSGGLWDYASHLDAWSDCFGEAHLQVRVYEPRQLLDGDVRKDFLAQLQLQDDGFAFSDERVNTHINNDLLEFQRQMNRLPLTPQEKRCFHKDLIRLTAAAERSGIFSDRPALDAPARAEVMARFEEGNRRVALRCFGRPTLFAAPPTLDPPAEEPPPGLTTEKLAAIVAWLMASRCSNDAPPDPNGRLQ